MDFISGIPGICLLILVSCFVIWVLFRGANPKSEALRVYIAGTISGNRAEGIVDQDYRQIITEALNDTYPNITVDDPRVGNENSVTYNDSEARQMFEGCLNRIIHDIDIVIAYIPEASMGTAIELYEAQRHGKLVIIISPLTSNWIVRLYGHLVFPSLDMFVDYTRDGGLSDIVTNFVNDFDGSRIWNL